MPFDCLPTETDQLVSLDQPSLRGLAYALRHREVWPAGFVWDYRECTQCAMGLAARLWRQICLPCPPTVCSSFNIPDDERSDRIFFGARRTANVPSMGMVTPEHVADAIDAYLAAG